LALVMKKSLDLTRVWNILESIIIVKETIDNILCILFHRAKSYSKKNANG